jgi:uncharacterized protein (TIGR03067 family)
LAGDRSEALTVNPTTTLGASKAGRRFPNGLGPIAFAILHIQRPALARSGTFSTTRVFAMNAWSLIAAVLLGFSPPGASDELPENGPGAVKGDLERVQGVWVTQAGPRKKYSVVLEIREATARVEIRTPQGLTIHAEGLVRIDDSVTPRALDWANFKASDGQQLPDVPAIYEFDGETLRVCNGGLNGRRPTEFVPGEGSLADVVVFRRKP